MLTGRSVVEAVQGYRAGLFGCTDITNDTLILKARLDYLVLLVEAGRIEVFSCRGVIQPIYSRGACRLRTIEIACDSFACRAGECLK